MANQLLSLLFAVAFLLAAWRDGTLVLAGPDVGLLEHPTLLSFLLLQLVVFRAVVASMQSVAKAQEDGELPFLTQFFESDSAAEISTVADSFFQRKSNLSRITFFAFTTLGLLSLVWNSFQNQDGLLYLGFDFWDSSNHPFGYWTTRVYKLYLWVLFLPAIGHLVTGLFVVLSRLVAKARYEQALELQPYHSDACGGMSSVVTPLTRPLLSVFVVCSLASISAFAVHMELDATPLLGTTLLAVSLLSVLFLYLRPLGQAIRAEKKARISAISDQQQRLLAGTLSPRATISIANSISAIQALASVKKTLRSIPNYPYLRAVSRLIGILLGSQYLLAAGRVLIGVAVQRLLQ